MKEKNNYLYFQTIKTKNIFKQNKIERNNKKCNRDNHKMSTSITIIIKQTKQSKNDK